MNSNEEKELRELRKEKSDKKMKNRRSNVRQRLMLKKAVEKGITVSKEEIDKYIKQMKV